MKDVMILTGGGQTDMASIGIPMYLRAVGIDESRIDEMAQLVF